MNGSQEYQSWTNLTANTRLAENRTMRKHHFTETKTMMILNNINNNKEKIKKKNILNSNNMDIHRIGILN